ncbi:YrhA family protein [Bacillus swezeyi]|uniref:YrhA family protein n=1 Tax=Bacillus swezeyi TaxID=1925020 RepID=UPI0027DDDD8E|nr:YrhA family protein [Bacillus swezeyi]
MWKAHIEEIRKIERKYGDDLNKPVSIDVIKELEQSVQEKFDGTVLPEEYKQFLKTVNGLDFNGLVIYGVDSSIREDEVDEEIHGFIETNEIWHENDWQKKYLFFGDSDVSLYCLDTTEGKYLELDKPSGTIMSEYENFNSMLEEALSTSLS